MGGGGVGQCGPDGVSSEVTAWVQKHGTEVKESAYGKSASSSTSSGSTGSGAASESNAQTQNGQSSSLCRLDPSDLDRAGPNPGSHHGP